MRTFVFALSMCLISLTVSAQKTISDEEREAFFSSLEGRWSPNANGWTGAGSLEIILIKYGEDMLAVYNQIIWCSNGSSATENVECGYDVMDGSITINYKTLYIEDNADDNYWVNTSITIPYQAEISEFLVAYVSMDLGTYQTNNKRYIFYRCENDT